MILVFVLNSTGQDKCLSQGAPKSSTNPPVSDERLKLIENGKAQEKLEEEVFKILNQKRIEKGLEPLRWNEDLARIARSHSENMAKFRFFSHVDMNKHTVAGRVKSFGIKDWKAIGENIGFARNLDSPAISLCEMWMKSETHRKNILDSRYDETGIGVAIAEDGTYYFTQIFMRRR
jgi:uncharacterized protein YkwD